MEQGIAAIQQGNLDEGSRLLKIALKSNELQGAVRATALLWLAETVSDRQQKIAYYNQALSADPTNDHARQRVAQLLAADLPGAPPQPQTTSGQQFAPQPQQRGFQLNPNAFYRTVGVYDGPNGAGTGFFLTREGLIATSRFVVGGVERVRVETERGQFIDGQVVRSFPPFDLAFIHTGLTINQMLPAANNPDIPDNTPLRAMTHSGSLMQGERRATKSSIRPEWFPTTIAEVADAGGNPIFDDRNMLVGMLTRNANRSSPYVFGLHISVIYRQVDLYVQEIAMHGDNLAYCPACGRRSRTLAAGGFYCETCGHLLPAAQDMRRYPQPQMAALYGENIHRPCPNCESRVGFFDNHCLRCGHELTSRGR
jgi:hypothetical protein